MQCCMCDRSSTNVDLMYMLVAHRKEDMFFTTLTNHPLLAR